MKAALTVLLLLLWPAVTLAQGFSALARIDAERSRIGDLGAQGVQIDLVMDPGVPYRVFTLDNPPRLVVDFQEVDWSGLTGEALLQTERIAGVQFGAYVPGWSRLVADLGRPLGVDQVALELDKETLTAHLRIALVPVDAQTFAAEVGAPRDARWDLPAASLTQPDTKAGDDAPLRVVLDPGHGGIDPGAETETVSEKALMLTFARELREALLRAGGFDVILTRDDDHFVSLERRVALAHQAGADVFISLHADSLAEGQAHGATVHVLSPEASDVASAKLAERHDRGDLLSGADLSGTDDEVVNVLLDLARQETRPRTEALAQRLVEGMTQVGGPMNRRPLRSAAFSVLKAADIPSVLIEIGFVSSPRDLKNLQDEEWRAGMARGIRNGLIEWAEEDVARKALIRR